MFERNEKFEKIRDFVARGANILLMVWSVYFVVNGVNIMIQTSGTVYGTEFGFLIYIAKELGEIFVWLGLYAIASRLRPAPKKEEL